MSAQQSEGVSAVAGAVARNASGGDTSALVECIADTWRRVVGAPVGIVFAAGGNRGWTSAATSPAGLMGDPQAGVVLAGALPDGIVRQITADEVPTAFSGLSPAVLGIGVGVRLTPTGQAPVLLVALGVDGPVAASVMDAAQALATISVIALERDTARAQADAERARATSLVSAGIVLSAELNLEDVLQRLVDTAREVLSAKYAALGVLDEDGAALANFVTSGLSADDRHGIGELPRGRGLLGLLITEPYPVRVPSIADDARSAGFPAGHPQMTTFLGVPIRVGAKVFGNLYVTDKLDRQPFSAQDELVSLTLAAQAAVAIGNAQRYSEQEQSALQASRERERATADGLRRAIEAQEAERARIARELHDEAGQELTALALQLRAMDDHVTDEPGRAHLAAVRHALARTSTNLRALAIELRPSGLKDHGLASAIGRQAARVQESSGIAIDVAVAAIPDGLDDAFEIALFRVVQEALTNVVRHSGAKRASVVASLCAGRLRVVIEDDGRGFDPSAPTDRLGLAGIRERIQLLGGGLRIESARRVGTTVIVELEVSNA